MESESGGITMKESEKFETIKEIKKQISHPYDNTNFVGSEAT